jgi:hypothetical protein
MIVGSSRENVGQESGTSLNSLGVCKGVEISILSDVLFFYFFIFFFYFYIRQLIHEAEVDRYSHRQERYHPRRKASIESLFRSDSPHACRAGKGSKLLQTETEHALALHPNLLWHSVIPPRLLERATLALGRSTQHSTAAVV